MSNLESLLSYKDVAKRLGVSERTVKRLKSKRKLPFVMVSSRVLFKPDDVERYIASQRAPGTF